MTEKKRTISPTAIDVFADCGVKGQKRYLEPRRDWRSTPKMTCGTIVHRCFEQALRLQVRGAPLDLDTDDWREMAHTTFWARWNKDAPTFLLTDDEEATGADELAKLYEPLVFTMFRKLLLSFIPTLDVAEEDHIEKFFRLEVEGASFDLVGRWDWLEMSRSRIGDLKTRANKPPEDALNNNTGMAVYDLAAMQVFGLDKMDRVLAIITRGSATYLTGGARGKPPALYTIEAGAPTNHDAILHRIAAVDAQMKSGCFVPAKPDGPGGWVCSSKGCEFFDECKFGRARVESFPAPTMKEIVA